MKKSISRRALISTAGAAAAGLAVARVAPRGAVAADNEPARRAYERAGMSVMASCELMLRT